MTKELPIACTLSGPELRVRQEGLIQELMKRAQQITSLTTGYEIHFGSESGLLPQLAEFIEQEHECCPFLHFTLTVGPTDAPIHLTITGPEGTTAFLQDAFRLLEHGDETQAG